MLIALSDIAVIHRQRSRIEPDKVLELAKSIEEVGLLHPIVVRLPFAEEQALGKPYVLCVGGRRLAAHMLLQRTHIEATMKEQLDPILAEIAELDENMKRENITWQDEVAARERIHMLRLKINPFQTLQQTAEEIGISVAQLHKDIQLHKAVQADPELKKSDTKGRAVRKQKHKAHIAERTAQVAKVTQSGGVSDLRKKIVCANASQFIRTIPSQSVDMVFTDLPYGMDAGANIKDAEQLKGHYDDSQEKNWDLITDLVPQMVRVLKPTGWLVLFMSFEGYHALHQGVVDACAEHADYVMQPGRCRRGYTEKLGPCRFLTPELPPWYWYRMGATNMGHWPELHAANRIDMILVANGGKAKLIQPCTNVITVEGDKPSERFHYMQKDLAGCKRLIERCTVQGELVADFTCGGGNHLAAAASLGRDILGCENNPDSYEAAIANVMNHYKPEAVRWAIERGKQGAAATKLELLSGASVK